MPRAKMTRPKKVDAVVTSGDSEKTLDVDQGAEQATKALVDTAPAVESDPLFAAGDDAPEVKEAEKKSPKASRRAKTCTRCDERRKREREYARVSRDRARIARLAKKGEVDAEASEKPEKTESDKVEVTEEGMKASE